MSSRTFFSALTVIVAIVNSNCLLKPPHSYEFSIGDNVPKEHYPYIYGAAQEWNNCGVITATIVNDKSAIPISYVDGFIRNNPKMSGISLSCDYICDGCVNSGTHVLYRAYQNDLSVPQDYTQSVIAHEMGHIFGLDHFGGPYDLMNPIIKFGANVSENDCNELKRVHPDKSLL